MKAPQCQHRAVCSRGSSTQRDKREKFAESEFNLWLKRPSRHVFKYIEIFLFLKQHLLLLPKNPESMKMQIFLISEVFLLHCKVHPQCLCSGGVVSFYKTYDVLKEK